MSDDRPRWEPDEHLVPAILAGSATRMSGLSSADRCWVVAGLTLAGLTAEDIADRLGCSLRLVRSIRAEDMTRVCSVLQSQTSVFANEVRLARSEAMQMRGQLQAAHAELAATRDKLSRLLDARMGVKRCGKCGESMSGYNLYVHNGKEFCRTCHRRRQQSYRDSRCLTVVLPGVVAISSQ